MKCFFTICFLFLFSSVAFGQREKSALLPASEAKILANQCSRKSPTDFTDTWQPTPDDVKLMESKFSAIKKLRTEEGEQIKNLERPYMQYVGIIVKEKRLIYISAFYDPNPDDNWKKHAWVICDGGNAWEVLYEPKTGKFFDLAVNGVV